MKLTVLEGEAQPGEVERAVTVVVEIARAAMEADGELTPEREAKLRELERQAREGR